MSNAQHIDRELQWFVRRGSKVLGPIASGQVRHFVIEGKLSLDDEVSSDRQHWRRVSEVEEVIPFQFRHDGRVDEEDYRVQARRDRRQAMLTIFVAASLLLAAVGATLWLGNGRIEDAATCDAAPEPGVLWRGCGLDGVEAVGADLTASDLSNASLVNARLGGVSFRDADLRYANLAGADVNYGDIRRANLKGANLRGADLTNADAQDANLSFADLTGARLGGIKLAGANLSGAVWIDGTRCPQGATGSCR